MLRPLLEQRVADPEKQSTRLMALDRLIKFMSGFGEDGTICHYCPFGWHASFEAAIDDFFDMLNAMFFDHASPVPAYNKWTKVWPALVWFAVVLQLC